MNCKQTRVMDTPDWEATHKAHGDAVKILNENQPPRGSYRMYTLICPCGARHILIKESNED